MASNTSIADRIGGIIDTAVAIFSPERGARRRAYRHAGKIQAKWFHKGADYTRLRSGWNVANVPADTANLGELPTLRGRSHDLLRNSGIAAGLADTFVVNEVGIGIRPQSRIDHEAVGISLERAQELQKTIERGFRAWSPSASYDNRNSVYALQELASRSEFSNGEAFLFRRYRKRQGNPYSLCFQMVAPERVCTPNAQVAKDRQTGKEIRDGIEMDATGEPVAYWVANENPLGGVNFTGVQSYQRIPAFGKDGRRNVIHLYHQKREDQSHGVPALGPVIDFFDHLTGYFESEWVRARVGASFAAFIKTTEGASTNASNNASGTDAAGLRMEKILPGTIQYLNEGEDIEFGQPNITSNFDPFVLKALQFIGAGLGLPLELVLKDFTKSNYSSARAALLEARRVFRTNQQRLIEKVCQAMWELLIDEMVLRCELPVRDYEKNRHEYCRATHIAPGWEWVDPEKEINAKVTALENNLSTYADEYSDMGKDWEEQMRQRALEQARMDELGLKPPQSKVAQPDQTKQNGDGHADKNHNAAA